MKTMVNKDQLANINDPMTDPLQFDYWACRGTDDTKILTLNTIHKHLEAPPATARLLFRGFSSTFTFVNDTVLLSLLSGHRQSHGSTLQDACEMVRQL